jgi:hypothetical protein
MIENKSEALVAIFIVTAIVGAVFFYSQTYEQSSIGIFPEKLSDMNITSYKGGYAAIEDIKGLHDGLPRRIENAYVVEYGNNSSNKAKFWISEAVSNGEAVSLVNTMSRVVENSGVYSNLTLMNIEGIDVYFVSGLAEYGLYRYFYTKSSEIFWIQVDNPNESRRINFLEESIKRI